MTSEFSLIELSGTDAVDWLQGQATGDVRPLLQGVTVSFCICAANGQMISVCDAALIDGLILISCPRATVTALLDRVDQMVIMEDVSSSHRQDLHLTFADVGVKGAEHVYANRRLGTNGIDSWASSAPSSIEDLTARRLLAGEPLWGADMDSRTLPPEMGPQFEARYVSYAKGCYVGQEILMRIHSRGHTNKTWVGLILPEPVQPGAAVMMGEREAGKITSVAHSAELGWIGAATLRNEALSVPLLVEGKLVEARQMPLLR